MTDQAGRSVLLIAFHFPPIQGSSGVHRTLAFARYLPDFGWEPTVLSVWPQAYRSISEDADAAAGIRVVRSWALDATRHLAIRGRHLAATRLPDPWGSWLLSAIPRGLQLIRRLKPDVIFATCPTPTALMIGNLLHRLTGVPWVADFRDPVYDDDDPHVSGGTHASLLRYIEERSVRSSARVLLTAPSAREIYVRRYPDVTDGKFVILENGYDEQAFAGVKSRCGPFPHRPLRIVHSGTLYSYARNPTPLFDALAALKTRGEISGDRVKFVFRASGDETAHHARIQERGLSDVVELAPSVPYRVALAEMLEADALLLLQAANSNYQIPAKLYEYLRAGRPILALTDSKGDTAEVLRQSGVTSIVELDSAEAIERAVPEFLRSVASGTAPVPSSNYTLTCDRRFRTRLLADTLNDVINLPSPGSPR